jgi:hypothetical protein
MNKVTIIAENGNTKTYKTKGNFDVPFSALAPSIKTTYFFTQRDLDYINNKLNKLGCTTYDARIFVIGGRNSQFISNKVDARKADIKTLPYLHWDNVYQFLIDNAILKNIS